MNIRSTYFATHLTDRVGDIPSEALQELIEEFASNAKFFMGSDTDAMATAKINEAVIAMLKGQFRFMALNIVAEAYSKGSCGELGGTTRFTFRNVYIWLKAMEEASQKQYRDQESRKDEKRKREDEKTFRLQKSRSNLYGAAMMWKIAHAREITSSQYDFLTLDRIVEATGGRAERLSTLRLSDIL